MTAATDDLASDLVDLVRRIRAGELRAETELVARYLPAARAITRRDCRAYEAAVDDIVQDVLTRQRLREALHRRGSSA